MFGKKKIKPENFDYRERRKDPNSHKESRWLTSLLLSTNKISFQERFLKFVIYLALRLVIVKPSRWKDPQKNFEIIDRTYKKITSQDFAFIPSSVAYYIVMSFAPIILLLVAFFSSPLYQSISEVYGEKDPLTAIIGPYIPGIDVVITQIQGQMADKDWGSFMGVLTIILFIGPAMWVSSSGFAKLIYSQSYIYQHRYVGGYWANKGRGLMMLLFFTFIIAFTLIINVIMEFQIDTIEPIVAKPAIPPSYAGSGPNGGVGMPGIPAVEEGSLQWLETMVRVIWLTFSMTLMLFLGFASFFKFSPRFKIKFRYTLPGAMVATLPTVIFFAVFGALVQSKMLDYTYFGTIGTIMYLGLAAYWVIYFLYLGIITNAAYYKTFVSTHVEQKWTISRK